MVTWPFPKGDHYIQVLNFVIEYYAYNTDTYSKQFLIK